MVALKRLRECERRIKRHEETFVDAAVALKEVRDARLYRSIGYRDFNTYCSTEWGWSLRWAKVLLAAAEIRLALPDDCVPDGGWKASTLRPLISLRKLKSIAAIRAAAEAAIEESRQTQSKLSGEIVSRHVAGILGKGPRVEAPEPATTDPRLERLMERYDRDPCFWFDRAWRAPARSDEEESALARLVQLGVRVTFMNKSKRATA